MKGKKIALFKDILKVEKPMTKQELEVCIQQYGKDIYSFCKYLTCNQEEADDLYQDTFLMAVELQEKIEYKENPKSYLLSIALRIWKNKKRKFAWRKKIADIQPMVEMQEIEAHRELEVSLEEQVMKKETEEFVRNAVNHLLEKLKIVVLLFYMEGLSTKQIAKVIKLPTGTVLSRLHQARKLLKKELEVILDEETIG